MKVDEYDVLEPGEQDVKIFFGLLIGALLLGLVIWAAFLAREFVHKKIENDSSIAESTQRIADAAMSQACGDHGYFFADDRIYECEHSPKKTFKQKSAEMRGGFKDKKSCEKLNGATACSAFAEWGTERLRSHDLAWEPK